ncbi:probable pectinesterase 56 [Solanum lycopersicum]|uniref:probable pectinesterase 56 n=1 Tax=Solanum lycopersicum TaxID=4081 RepID=UPI00374A7653
MDGLQNWARTKLKRRQFRTIYEVIMQAEALKDFRYEKPDKTTGEDMRGSQDHDGGDGGKGEEQRPHPKKHDTNKSDNKKSGRHGDMERTIEVAKRGGCYICGVQSQLTKEIPYNAVVSTDGIGNFNTTSGAILATPDHNVKPLFINLKNGTYQKYIRVDETKTTIILIREGMNTMIITDNRSFVDGNRTYDTAIVGVAGNGFIAQNITFRNNVGPIKHQAVTLRVDADLVSFYECHFDGYQDTLYVKRQIQSYCDCEIYRTIDFICGDATAVFQNYLIEACTPMARQYNTIIEKHQELELFASGILFQNCTIKATHDLEKSVNVTTYLGRPWGLFSRTVIMESYIDRLIDPRGWVE